MQCTRIIFLLFSIITSVTTVFSQNRIYSSLDAALDNPLVSGVQIISSQNEIVDFISQKDSFINLSRVQILRYTDKQSDQLLMANLSTFSELNQVEIDLADLKTIPSQIDNFDQLNRLIITASQLKVRLEEPFRFIALNGQNNPMVIEIHADKKNSIAFMDLFFEEYPNMVKPIASFEVYTPRRDLRKLEGTGYRFQPVRLPEANCFKIDPAQESKIIASDGSVFTIPANSLVNQRGRLIQDSVQIDITKIADAMDMAFSRIPMKTTDNEWLESAGMFEINASRNGELLKLAQTKSISVEFYSTAPGSFNIYEMDAERNAWSEIDTNNTPENTSNQFTGAFMAYNRFYTGLSQVDQFDVNSKSTDHFESADYLRFDKRSDTEWAYFDIENPEDCEVLRRRYKRHVNKPHRGKVPLFQLQREKDQHKALSKHYFFSFDQRDRAINALRGISRHIWYTVAPMNSSDFRNNFRKDKVYIDFRLSYLSDAGSFQFVFKDVCGIYDTLVAKPFAKNTRNSDKDDLFHQHILEQYNEDWSREVEKLNRLEERDVRRFNTQLNKELDNRQKEERDYWESIQEMMVPAEKDLSFEEWQTYFLSTLQLYQNTMLRASRTGQSFIRQFDIPRLGFWNCDRPILQKKAFKEVKILAKNKMDKSGAAISVCAIFQNFNTTLNTGELSKYHRTGANAYIIFDGDDVSWIKPEEAEGLKGGILKVNRPFVSIEDIDYDRLKSQIMSWSI